ncbi:tyrosine-specific transport protein [Waddlia chondrophila 2032/99]|uniref:Tyrosine/tryptophan transport protein n=2 Tax=Waddlia chondrophila TaxID=71667 RepID=D6YTV3_WADCW|nr:aromatic amino acid transport family protein [Waddlia chondrophila]ADI37564.1 tyrosine/tryptophan transport protein [Waddlia chondrophila WSU 86-1044]CCB91769.1 tyrosine-specific transport protein [Waddlia chondrophila 2032/99]
MNSVQSNYRVFGATLLVAGCCIGAGMLGLPVLTALGGFLPTCLLFFFCWLFMAATGLLLLEVNLWFKEEVNVVTMASRTLGPIGAFMAWFLFAFLFYSLMVAYISASGQLIADRLQTLTGVIVAEWAGSLFLTLLFSVFLYLGTTMVDRVNRLLMLGLAASYLILVCVGSRHVRIDLLSHVDWSASAYAIPAMIVSFGFHNLVPSLATYLDRDVKKLRFSIVAGSAIPLVIYLMWEWLILGLIPLDGENGFRQALGQGDMATRALRNIVGSAWVVDLAEAFAFFAIITSFLSVSLSFVDFLADGLHIRKTGSGKVKLCVLSLTPPFLFALFYPGIFLKALSYAGAFGAVILFGVMPAAMAYQGRYRKNLQGPLLIPGGKGVLALIFIVSIAIVCLEMVTTR